jgi:hypothetical protein
MRRILRPHLDWLLGLVAVLLLYALLFGTAAAQLRYAVTLPNGCSVLACGLTYHLPGDQTRLIELAACPGESTDLFCPQIHRDGFEVQP